MKNELKIGSILSLSSVILGSLIQILYTPMYMKYLGTSDYGINSLVQSIMGCIGILNLGLGSAIVRYTIRYRSEGKIEEEKSLNGMFLTIFFVIMGISILIGFYLYFMIPTLFIEKFTSIELRKTQKVFIIMMISTAISFPVSVFTTNIVSRQKFIYQKGLSLIKLVITPIVGAILMIKGFGLLAVVISVVVLNLIIYIFDVFYAFKLGMKVKFKNFDINILKDISKYSFYIFLNIIIDRIYWGTDRIIIGKYIGTSAVGIYAIASIFNQVYIQLSSSISGVLFPKVNLLIIDNKLKEVSDLFIKVGRIQYILLGLISSGFIVFGKEFIFLWLGSGYSEVYIVSLWLIIPLTIPLIQNTGIAIMQARNLHQFRSIVYLFIAILNIVNSIQLVKSYGMIGCAVATGLSFIFGHIIIMNIYYQRRINIDIILFWKNIFKMTIPIIIVFILGIIMNKFINNYSFKTFIFKGSSYTLFYLIFMYFMGMNIEEKNEVKKLLKKLRILK
ncbi:lipopolysaccharide biosynthesis protein [Fusobacterium mortiferum]|uniref:lipopolysaccharide biosynthesis protein n=1 Tax=Fusobacterium mortiferum TaxID=850 RepID=UPI0021C34745|nr:oligosaccharide flippase family protein [Fusobacterium mortiferum]